MKDKKIKILNKENRLGENPFSVPEGYFGTLSSRIQSRVESEKKNTKGIRNLRFSLRSQIALAASLIGFAIISYAAVKLILSQPVSQADYIDFALLEDMSIDFDESLLLDAYQLEDSEYTEEDMWAEEAVEYLASNELEIDLLYEQY